MLKKPTYKDLEQEVANLRAKISQNEMECQLFEQYFNNNTAIMLQIDPSSKGILSANLAALKFYGYSKEEFLKKSMYEINLLENAEIDKLMQEAVKKKSNFFEFQHQTANGEIKDVEIYMSPFKAGGKIRTVITIHDVTDRKNAEKELKANNIRFETTMNALDAIVYVADMDSYELLFANEPFVKEFGDDFNKPCYQIIQKGHESPCPFCTNKYLVDANNQPTKPYVWEFQNTRTKRWYQCRDQAIRWIDGKLVRLEIATDITNRKLMEEELRESEKKLVELNTTKDKFFSIIAHDLKSPINSVLGFASLLSNKFDKYETKDHKKFINIIRKGLEQAYKLLDNLLLWSRTQKATIEFIPEKLNFYLLISETIDLLKQNASNKSITIKMKVVEDTLIYADKNMVLTILRNLLSNAIKFTMNGGSVIIRSEPIKNLDGSPFLKVMVEDTGVGISEDRLESLFDISVDSSTKGTENESGTGLGLILCKEFITLHKGEIWAESKHDKGSRFYFTLPLNGEPI